MSTPDPVGFVRALLAADPNIDQAFKAVFGACAFIDRRVVADRRQQEFLTEVDRRRDEFRYGRRGTDMAPDPLEQSRYELRQEKARDERDGQDRYGV